MSDSFYSKWPDMEECSIKFVYDERRKEAHVKTISTAKTGNETRKKGALDNFTKYGHYKRTCGEVAHIPEVDKKSGYPVTSNAFYRCTSLQRIKLPDGVEKVGKYIDGEPESEPCVIYRGQVYDSINDINL